MSFLFRVDEFSIYEKVNNAITQMPVNKTSASSCRKYICVLTEYLSDYIHKYFIDKYLLPYISKLEYVIEPQNYVAPLFHFAPSRR